MHTCGNDLWVRGMKHDTKTREEPYRCSKKDEEKHVRTLKEADWIRNDYIRKQIKLIDATKTTKLCKWE